MALVSMRATSLVSIASFHSVYSQGNDKERVKMTIEVKPGKGREGKCKLIVRTYYGGMEEMLQHLHRYQGSDQW